jgi:lipopolysaccharide transport system ATP-binding protein
MRQNNEILVRAKGVSKKFCRSLKKSLWYGVKDIASETNPFAKTYADRTNRKGSELREAEFWANDDISFELRRGECLGLIGHNGAGKTTLLKMLNGLIKPDSGTIEMYGRVGALIALGAGFNPILTGRENIYVNGSILGLRKKEIDVKIGNIIDFAEIGDFIDSPVQSYSSGMQVRLGFAVATALDPDILILDEVLAVGDASFRAKCYNRIGELQKSAAVIFVSHSMDQVARICDRALFLSKGKQLYSGRPEDAIPIYEAENAQDEDQLGASFSIAEPIISGRFDIVNQTTNWNDKVEFVLELTSTLPMEGLKPHGIFYDSSGAIAASFMLNNGDGISLEAGVNRISLKVEHVTLAAGRYSIGFVVNEDANAKCLLWSFKKVTLSIVSSPNGFSHSRFPLQIEV